jgi:protein-disulfide isomerase
MRISQWEARLAVPVSPERDHIQGPLNAPITLLEYGDYECPFCAAARPTVRQLQGILQDSMRFVFRNFPLTTAHPHAEIAAESAEAAGAQGAFWEMHDTLFLNQDRLDPKSLLAYAEALGLHTRRFAADLAQHNFEPRVREDFMSGVRSGVNGTPTFYVNDVRHDGDWDLPPLLAAMRQAAYAANASSGPETGDAPPSTADSGVQVSHRRS